MLEAWGKYAILRGRAGKSEFWLFFLCYLAIYLVTAALDFAIGYTFFSIISSMVFVIPLTAVAVRRLHDLDQNGWWVIIYFIPFVGSLPFLIYMCFGGSEGENRFGKNSDTIN